MAPHYLLTKTPFGLTYALKQYVQYEMPPTPNVSRPDSPVVSIHDTISTRTTPIPPCAEADDLEEYLRTRWFSGMTMTQIEDTRNSYKIAAKMAKVLGTKRYEELNDYADKDPDVEFHLKRLRRFFGQANQAAATHCNAAGEYPLRIASWLHEKLDDNKETSINVSYSKYLKKNTEATTDEYIQQIEWDIIRYQMTQDNYL